MKILQIRCTGVGCPRCMDSASGRCRFNVLAPKDAIPFLDSGGSLDPEARSQLLSFLPDECENQADFKDRTVGVVWSAELNDVAQRVYVVLLTEFPIRKAKTWMMTMLRPMEGIPVQIRQIFHGARKETELDRFVELREALWDLPLPVPLAA